MVTTSWLLTPKLLQPNRSGPQTRTCRAHQVTASSLYVLLQRAYTQYLEDLTDGSQHPSFDDWCAHRLVRSQIRKAIVFFTTHLQLLSLLFVKSIRQSNFTEYVSTLETMLPRFFAMNQPNYPRWISIYCSRSIYLLTKVFSPSTSLLRSSP